MTNTNPDCKGDKMSYSWLLEQLMNGKTSIKGAMDVFIWKIKNINVNLV